MSGSVVSVGSWMGLVGVVVVCRWMVWVGRVVRVGIVLGSTVELGQGGGQGRQEAAV